MLESWSRSAWQGTEDQVPTGRLRTLLLTHWCMQPQDATDTSDHDAAFLHYTYDTASFQTADPFFGGRLANVSLEYYIERLLQHITTAPFPCVVMALRLIDKYHHSTMGTVARSNVHLIFAVAMVVVSKAHCDENMSWEYYCRVIGAPSALLSNLEIIMLFECRWDILPSFDEYAKYRALLLPPYPEHVKLLSSASDYDAVASDASHSRSESLSDSAQCPMFTCTI